MVGVGLWIASAVVPAVWEDWENWAFDRDVQRQTASIGEYVATRTGQIVRGLEERLGVHVAPESAPTRSATRSEPSPAPAAPAPQPTTLRPNSLIGRLAIPRHHLRAIVREGTSSNTLGLAVGHIPGTALPWQSGNVGVAGHRDTLFRGMGKIRKHDLIQFETRDTNYVYEVASTEIVTPKDVNVLKPGPYPELTLVTCYPFNYFGSAPDRFIVQAREVYHVSQLPSGSEEPSPPDPVRSPQKIESRAAPGKVIFNISTNHSRQLAPGISLGVTATDTRRQKMDGWVWLMPDRRTVWLRDQGTHGPFAFYGYESGKRHELVITRVTPSSVTGYLVL
jgi:sortase A